MGRGEESPAKGLNLSQDLSFLSKARDEAALDEELKQQAGGMRDQEGHEASFLPIYHQCGDVGQEFFL